MHLKVAPRKKGAFAVTAEAFASKSPRHGLCSAEDQVISATGVARRAERVMTDGVPATVVATASSPKAGQLVLGLLIRTVGLSLAGAGLLLGLVTLFG